MADRTLDGDLRRACFGLYKESLAWEAARRRRWFSSAPFYGQAIHKVSRHDINTAWCGRGVPPNGPVVWYEPGELPVTKSGRVSPRVCARCKRESARDGELVALYAQIEQYQEAGPGRSP
jgi:hypothetical protein